MIALGKVWSGGYDHDELCEVDSIFNSYIMIYGAFLIVMPQKYLTLDGACSEMEC